MGTMVSRLTSLTIVYWTVYSGTDEKTNIKAPRHWSLWGEFTGDRWIPRTKASNVKNVSIWLRHHDTHRALEIRRKEGRDVLEIAFKTYKVRAQ